MCSWHELIFNKPFISQICMDFFPLKNQASSSMEFLIDSDIWIYFSVFNIIHIKKKGKFLVSQAVDDTFFSHLMHLLDSVKILLLEKLGFIPCVLIS